MTDRDAISSVPLDQQVRIRDNGREAVVPRWALDAYVAEMNSALRERLKSTEAERSEAQQTVQNLIDQCESIEAEINLYHEHLYNVHCCNCTAFHLNLMKINEVSEICESRDSTKK